MTIALIKNLISGEFENAELIDEFAEEHLKNVEDLWNPLLRTKYFELRQAHINKYGAINKTVFLSELAEFDVQDAAWNWRNKLEAERGKALVKSVVMVCNNQTQGLLMLDSGMHRGRIETQVDSHLTYIKYIAAAPWNRSKFTNTPNYKYVGSVLIATAINNSINEEFEGRIGLHALPQAEQFYEQHCGMTNLGKDPETEGLVYFEMTAPQALKFIRS